MKGPTYTPSPKPAMAELLLLKSGQGRRGQPPGCRPSAIRAYEEFIFGGATRTFLNAADERRHCSAPLSH